MHTFTPNTTISSEQVNENFEGLADGSEIQDNVVLARHINWAGTGSDSGIWWEELGRYTASGSVSVLTLTFSARKYLKVYAYGIATGGVLDTNLTFNSDTGTNYANKHSVNFAAAVDNVSATSIAIESGQTDSGQLNYLVMDIVNVASQEKSFVFFNVSQDAAGGGTSPTLLWSGGKWANTSTQITRIDWDETGAGSFATGSELVVLGHD